jgi:transcriptional regulator with XRE-family HTH domain
MKLHDFLSTPQGKTLNQANWARRVGVTRGYFSQLVQGDKLPSLQLAYTIEVATNRAVTMQDWMEDTSGGDHDHGLRGDDPETVQEAASG